MVNFISKGLLNILQLSTRRTQLPVGGIGLSQVQSVAMVEIQISSKTRKYEITLPCHVLPTIVSELPQCAIPTDGWNISEQLRAELADPDFYKAGSVDLLIGAGTFYEILEADKVSLGVGNLGLQATKFGWIVTGELVATCLMSVSSLGRSLEDDWKVNLADKDTYGQGSKANQICKEEEETLQHFHNSYKRVEDGRFVLRLPIKTDVKLLGDSMKIATARFINIKRRLQQDEPLRIQYTKFMNEYIKMGHMREVIKKNVPQRACYLPHHPVLKLSSLTTKLRVVFDASARTSSRVSLNDILRRGPVVQEDIFAILARFRKHQAVITADIEKMFRQILVAEEDTHLQRILWRPDPSKALLEYTLATVTYGTTPASFMATQCLMILADNVKQTHPRASEVIKRDFYMDDLMTGGENEEECAQLQKEVTAILESAKLPLRKWCSNSSSLIAGITKNQNDALFTLDLGDEDIIKSLGLCWQPGADQFKFNVTASPEQTKLTKRKLLSDLNKVFDPLGFLGPVLIRGKIFLQQLWQLKIDWDEQLDRGIQERWKAYYGGLQLLKELAIPRKCKPNTSETVQVHGFSDASMEAYGACIYIRSLDQRGEWHGRLLCSRTRVAPLKGTTIPRMELSGALLLVQLAGKVAESWNIELQSFYFWTDSMITLGWLNCHSSRLKTFVANRVGQILEQTKVQQWRHVRTVDNPADLITRGITAQELKESEIWWNGPRWLMKDDDTWSSHTHLQVVESDLPEQKVIKLALVVTNAPNKVIQYYSDWNRLRRGVAWLLRFIKYLHDKKAVSRLPYNSESELRQTECWILKRVQYEAFPEEAQTLKENKQLVSRSKLRCLDPYIKGGLILVGGRLNNSNFPETRKHPIVLPAYHRVTQIIFNQKHNEQLHCGPQALLAEVRRRYWPLRGRAVARSCVLKCIRCARTKPRFTEPMMAALPRQRVQCARPFTVVGVDFAGPLIIRSGLRRVLGVKAWIAVVVCFVTRAIHLEVVEDMTSKAFIASLRRFMSRRGRCTTIYSDNGTNFVGAQRELKAYITSAGPVMAQEGIEWRFNPPSAPHFGGLWESAVKSAKHHLSRMMGEAKLTLSELNTLLCQIEACLNSRPITPMSSDPGDPEALTPAHFLIGGAMTLPPEPDLIDEKPGYLRRWKYVQFLMQTFWRRWQLEYLPQFQSRGKWVTKTTPLQVDNIVIIKDDCMPPARWKLGRVTKVHPGSDGIIRVATVRTAAGSEMKRPTVKLSVLPTESDGSE